MKNKKMRILSMVLTGVIMTMTVFASCGNKPNETDNKNTAGQTGSDISQTIDVQDSISSEVEPETSPSVESIEVAKTYAAEDYGQIVEVREEFTGENIEEITFYYEMDKFYVNDSFENADKINITLQKIYDEYEQSYKEEAEICKSGGYIGEEPVSAPYNSWYFNRLTFVGQEYLSLLYNNVDYMGGAHPYSCFEGITIDCRTGEEVSASELLGKTDDEILEQVSKEMGMETTASWEEIDYYLTDATIVFVYRMGPLYWDDVVWERPLDVTTSEPIEDLSQETINYYMSIEPTCTFLTEDGMEYRMIEIDRAMGSSIYALVGTYDGKNCAFVNEDPYPGSGGEAKWITFVDENVGFCCLARSGGSYGSLYRTEDGGKSFAQIEYPSPEIRLSEDTYYNPFVMPELIYEEDGELYMEAGQGTDGDYYGEQGYCHGLYKSSDKGQSWEFVKEIPVTRE